MSAIQLTIPDDLVEEARRLAANDNEPLDDVVGKALAQYIRAVRRFEELRERGRREGTRERFLAAIDSGPNVPPIPGDELD